MNLRPDALAAHLAKPPAPLYILHGDAPLLVLEAADAIRQAARRHGYDERDTLVAGQGFRWEALTQAAGNLSLFGSRKLIDLRIPNGKPGRDGGEALQRYARTVNSDTITLVTLPECDWATRKSAWFKALDEAGVTLELNAPPRAQLPRWLAGRLAAMGRTATSEALEFISDHVEGNLLAAHQEILKLDLLHPQGELTLDKVRDAVLNVARYDIDDLRVALLEGDAVRCTRLLEGMKGEGAPPPLVLWAIANEIRTLAILRAGMDAQQPLATLFKSERVFDESRKQAMNKALPRLSAGLLRAALLHAAKVDRIIKGLGDGDVWSELLMLLLRLKRRPH
ncbi:MAG: DNA polymerase III subunit delta [Rhodocyclales bacterium]|nr:DNA polymerase III subunit delta [Rhodocyclales bacterium]